MDSLFIRELKVHARIGVHDWEQRISQPLLIDIRIPADFANCQDVLANTLDYDRLCQCVTRYVEAGSFRLIETVADSVAELVRSEFGAKEVTVSVSKPHAVKNAANIQVTVIRPPPHPE